MIHKKRSPKSITKADKTAEKSENLIAQNFQADKPNEKWLTDITEIPCQDGKVYLAPVLDCYDVMIVAFSMADHMKASLCVDAFEQACRKERCRGMLLHSDRGSQYTSRECHDKRMKKACYQNKISFIFKKAITLIILQNIVPVHNK